MQTKMHLIWKVGLCFVMAMAVASAQCGEQKVVTPVPPCGQFASSLSISGDALVVGAPGFEQIVFYQWSGTQWQQQGTAIPGPSAVGYGSVVVVEGDRAVIGMPQKAVGGVLNAGAIEIWTSPAPGVWSLHSTFDAPNPVLNGNFGASVDMNNDLLIIGEPGVNSRTGTAQIYRFDSSHVLSLRATLTPPADVVVGAEYGYDVGITNGGAVVGAPFDTGSGFTEAGRAHFWRRVAGVWNYNVWWTITRSFIHTGYSVDIDGDRAIVGSPALNETSWLGDSGFVMFIEWNGTQYVENGFDFTGVGDTHIGWAVAISGDRAIAGLPGYGIDDLQDVDDGAIWTYSHDGTAFQGGFNYVRSLDFPTQRYGHSVAIDGDRAVVGTPVDADGGSNAGAFYAYDVTHRSWLIRYEAFTSITSSTFGTPFLELSGSLCDNESVELFLQGGRPLSFVFLVVGLQLLDVPFLGGCLGPSPDLFVTGLGTNALGELLIPALMPPGNPPGLQFFVQAFVQDPDTPAGFSATHTYSGTAPTL
jgi:hypothetical protein